MKEWKGNADSVRTRLGINKKHTTKDRETDDFYATDPVALEKLIQAAPHIFAGNKVIWECACGNGNLAQVLGRHGFPTFASDLKNRGYGFSNTDFLEQTNFISADIILTNPPYSLATEFAEHALEILPDGGLYIAFMNISYLTGKKRYERLYSRHTLREVYIFSGRIMCYRNNDRENFSGSSFANFAWYVFQKGYTGNPTLYWL